MAAVQMSIISSHGGRARGADRKQALCVDAAAPSGSRGHEVDLSRGGTGVKCIIDAAREVSFELFYTVNCIVGIAAALLFFREPKMERSRSWLFNLCCCLSHPGRNIHDVKPSHIYSTMLGQKQSGHFIRCSSVPDYVLPSDQTAILSI